MSDLDTAQKQGVVVGLNEATGEVLDRLDIDQLLFHHPDTFNLYLLALADLQNEQKSNDDKMGWFQIAGIHGLPSRDWDGVAPNRQGKKGGYCPHGTMLFPTWHRPYLAMMEQTIYHKMLKIAEQFQDSKKQLEAVKAFRLPYWDYLRPRGGNTRFPGVKDLKKGTTGYGWDFSIPYILEVEQVMVFKPKSKDKPSVGEDELQVMDNPLYRFWFPRENGIMGEEWDILRQLEWDKEEQKYAFALEPSRDSTVRQAVLPDNQRSDHRQLNTGLMANRESAVEMLLNMLTLPFYKQYTNFSNKAVNSAGLPTVFGSIEGLHDTYHWRCGGEGHMSRVPVAAFDPVFWLHHCNVDRIIAIWQAINPKSWFPSPPIPNKEDEDTLLRPFRSPDAVNKKGFWASSQAKKTENFGYSYAGIRDAKSPRSLEEEMVARYGWSSQAYTRKNPKLVIPEDMKPLDLSKCPVFQYTDRTLDSRLSRTIQLMAMQEVSKTIPAVTTKNHFVLAEVPKVSESHTTVNVAALEAPTVTASPITVKKAATAEIELSEGPPNTSDEELISGRPEGTSILRQWYVDNIVKKAALDGAFTVYYFVGDFPDNSEAYSTAPPLAGVNHVFAAPAEACDNCGFQQAAGLRVSNTQPITPILFDYMENQRLQSLHPRDVVPFLRANLHWRVVGINQREVASGDVDGLEVSVSSSIAYLHPQRIVPEYIGGHTYPEITTGRAGGRD